MRNTDYISTKDTLDFNGKHYIIRRINVKGLGDRTIAGLSLEDALLKDNAYTSEEAKTIDENIFFYIDDKYLHSSDKQLAKYVAGCIS